MLSVTLINQLFFCWFVMNQMDNEAGCFLIGEFLDSRCRGGEVGEGE